MKKHILFLISFFSLTLLFAQSSPFPKVFYDSLNGSEAFSFVPAFDNGYMIVGETYYYQGLVFKMDTIGNIVWSRKYGLFGTTSFKNIIATNDSCFVIVGYTSGVSGKDAFCMKIRSNGDTVWTTGVGGSQYEKALSVQQTYDGGYIMTGNRQGINTTPAAYVFVAKLNSIGILEWTKELALGNGSNNGSSIKQTPDSGYVIAGFMANYPPYDQSAIILKLSSNGIFLWAKKFNLYSPVSCFGNDLVITNDGILYYMELEGAYAFALIKINFSGTIIWSKEYHYGAINRDIFGASPKIHKTHDNCYVFVKASCRDSPVIKVDSTGTAIWGRILGIAGIDLLESSDNGFIIIGNGPTCAWAPQGIPQIGIIKLDSLGNGQSCDFNNFTDSISFSSNTIISTSVNSSSLPSGGQHPTQLPINSINLQSEAGCVAIGSGILENNFDESISVFPLPAKDVINVKSEILYKV